MTKRLPLLGSGALHMQHDIFAEGSERQTCHLEMLPGKGDADDGDEEQHAEEEVHEACPQPAEDNPKNVERKTDAARRALRLPHLCAKRPQTQQTYLEGLQRHRNADDGDGHSQTSCEIADGCFETAEEPPQ